MPLGAKLPITLRGLPNWMLNGTTFPEDIEIQLQTKVTRGRQT